MKFEKATLKFISECGWNTESFIKFRDDFKVVSYTWGGGVPPVSASYFVKLLQQGVSARPPYGSARTYDIYYYDRREFRHFENSHSLFDHTMLWGLKNKQVICTSMPYGTKDMTAEVFTKMAEEFSFPASIKLRFLDDKYHYRRNGDFMLMIYNDNYKE